MAHKMGIKPSELIGMLEPWPKPPAGYVLAEGTSDIWTGTDIVQRGWIITPSWNATTDRHSIELWTAKGSPDEVLSHLTPAEAIQLAADLTTAARAIDPDVRPETDSTGGAN
jgi:hypothetical protein